ncbi:MAG: hypothetical protein U9O87_00475 [Verrucomicrobiota bacterium]|nr:hypothetical protein [Verrucomicrobiota bacterium]
MRTKLFLSLLAMCVFVGVNLKADLLSGSEELNLDFSEAEDSISKVSQSVKPMAEHLDKGISSLNSLIDKVKADPNLLNKSEFEVGFAKHLNNFVRDIDTILVNKQETEWAFNDIVLEVQRVAKRLDYKNDKMKEKISRRKEIMDKSTKQLKDLARKIERASKEDAVKLKREFKKLHRKYKMQKMVLKTHAHIQKQLQHTLAGMSKNGSSIARGAEDLATWFDNLKAQRETFIDLAEARKDMAGLTILVTGGGAHSIMNTFSKIRGIQSKLGEFNNTFDKMDENLDVLQTFDAGSLSLDAVDEELSDDEPWKEFL